MPTLSGIITEGLVSVFSSRNCIYTIDRTSRDKAEGTSDGQNQRDLFFSKSTERSGRSHLKSRPEVSKLSEKDQRAIFSASVGHRTSVETMLLCCCSMKAAIDDTQTGAAVF